MQDSQDEALAGSDQGRVAKVRRKHSEQFRRRVIGLCGQPGAVVATIARDHGIHVGLLRQWIRLYGAAKVDLGTAVQARSPKADEFIQLPLLGVSAGGQQVIRVQLQRGATKLEIDWPVSVASVAAQWLRDCVR